MSEKTEEPAEGAEAAPKKSKKKLIIILAVVLLIVGAGVPMFLMGGKKVPTEEEQAEQEEVKKLEVSDLGQFIVNLSETSAFLKCHIKIEYDVGIIEKQLKEGGGGGHGGGASGGGEGDKKAGALHPHLAARDTQIRDVIIRILSSKTAAEVLTQEGKERLKEELVEGINEASGMEEPPVTSVFFTDFIVQ